MDNLQQKIIDYVRENEPVSIAEIVKHTGVYRNKFYVIVAPLREQGLLFSRGGLGVFYNQQSFSKWMDDGGREMLSQRGRAGSEASLKTRREEPWRAREGSLKCIVMSCLKNSPKPLTLSKISDATGIPTKSASGTISFLIRIGCITHDGKRFARKYSLAEGVTPEPVAIVQRHGKRGGFVLFNPARNGVVEEYMKSPARARLMAVYGRMG